MWVTIAKFLTRQTRLNAALWQNVFACLAFASMRLSPLTEKIFVCVVFGLPCELQDGNDFLTYQDIEKLSRDMGEQMNFQQLNTIMDTATEQGTMRRVPFERFEEVCVTLLTACLFSFPSQHSLEFPGRNSDSMTGRLT